MSITDFYFKVIAGDDEIAYISGAFCYPVPRTVLI